MRISGTNYQREKKKVQQMSVLSIQKEAVVVADAAAVSWLRERFLSSVKLSHGAGAAHTSTRCTRARSLLIPTPKIHNESKRFF